MVRAEGGWLWPCQRGLSARDEFLVRAMFRENSEPRPLEDLVGETHVAFASG